MGSTQPKDRADGEDRLHGLLYLDTRLEKQLESLLLGGMSDDIIDVLLRPAAPSKGRRNPKVFIVVKKVDVDLYQKITAVTLQLTNLAPGGEMNFDIVPEASTALIPLEAISVKRR